MFSNCSAIAGKLPFHSTATRGPPQTRFPTALYGDISVKVLSHGPYMGTSLSRFFHTVLSVLVCLM
jgi:hypothetical protein